MYASKRFKLTFSILSVTYILLGIFLIVAPELAQKFTCYILGAIAILLGIVLVAFYFIKDNQDQVFRSGLASGVLLVAAGLYLFLNPEFLWTFLPVLLGFVVLYDSVFKLQNALDIKAAGFKHWWIFLIFSLITAVLGLLLIIYGLKIAALFFGIILIVDGVANMGVTLFTLWQSRQQQKAADDPEWARKKAEKKAVKAVKQAEKQAQEQAPATISAVPTGAPAPSFGETAAAPQQPPDGEKDGSKSLADF